MIFRSLLVFVFTAFFIFLNVSAFAQEAEKECPNSEGWKPTEEELAAILEAHEGWVNKNGWDDPSIPGRAVLCWANLKDQELKGVNLIGADLRYIDLTGANLENAKLEVADISDALLRKTNFKGADLWGANLYNSNMVETNIDGAIFISADFEFVLFEPLGAPLIAGLGNLKNLETVWFKDGHQSGLVQLRKALQEAGLRDLEREATYALEFGITRYQILGYHPSRLPKIDLTFSDTLDRLIGEPDEFFNGLFRLVFFEYTTKYGLKPSRALGILVSLLGLMTFAYVFPVLRKSNHGEESGIYKVWPQGRLAFSKKGPESAKTEVMERLTVRGFKAFAWALYFSLLSATTIGWRELNVGNWISRVQPKEFGLRGRGWVRVVSGAQSLISVYLLAIWALTYFGRPFQ